MLLSKKAKKDVEQEFKPKAIHLMDMPEQELDKDQPRSSYIGEYILNEEMVLVKGSFELGNCQNEAEIHENITGLLKQRFPFIRSVHFDFVKSERNKIVILVVHETFQWNYKNVKELCSQGNLYVRPNIPEECISDEMSAKGSPESEIEEDQDDELMRPVLSVHVSGAGCSLVKTVPSRRGYNDNDPSHEMDVIEIEPGSCQSNYKIATEKEKLKKLVPCVTEQELENALKQFGSLEGAADTLLQNYVSEAEKVKEKT